MRNPKVSIIIPVYNGHYYVRQAIDSALKQTYENLEIIVVNDGSKDDTDDILREYGNKIKYFKKENGGVSTALNFGIGKMTGEYFSWLSHDDLYSPNKIEDEINYLLKLKDKKAIVFSDFNLVDADGKKFATVNYEECFVNRNSMIPLFKSSMNGITLLIPKKAFVEVEKFDVNLRCVQDYILWFKMIFDGYTFYHLPKVLASTRVHAKQVSNTSPLVATEGVYLWEYLVDNIPSNIIKKYFNNKYFFYYTLAECLKPSPYNKSFNMVQSKLKEMEKPLSKKVVVSFIMDGVDESTEQINQRITEIKKSDVYDAEIIGIKGLNINDNNIKLYTDVNQAIKNAKGKYYIIFNTKNSFNASIIEHEVIKLELTNGVIACAQYGIDNAEVLNGEVLSEILLIPMRKDNYLINRDYVIENDIDFNNDFRLSLLNILKDNDIIGINERLENVDFFENYSLEDNINLLKSIIKDEKLSTSSKTINNIISLMTAVPNHPVATGCIKCAEMEKSISWKVTKPLRYIKKIIKKSVDFRR